MLDGGYKISACKFQSIFNGSSVSSNSYVELTILQVVF